jgi:hypothetical protein
MTLGYLDSLSTLLYPTHELCAAHAPHGELVPVATGATAG